MCLHANGKGRRAAHDEPGIEGRQHAAIVNRRFEIESIEIALAPQHGAAHRVAMAADIFGERVDDEIGAECQRPGRYRRCEGRVDHHIADAALMGELRQSRDVGEPHDRIGRSLDPQHCGLAADRRCDHVEIRCIDGRDLDAEARQAVANELRRADIIGVGDDEVIAGAEAAEEEGTRRRHAGGIALAGLGIFEGRELVLQLLDRRIGQPRIAEALVALAIMRREPGHFFGREGRRHHQIGR